MSPNTMVKIANLMILTFARFVYNKELMIKVKGQLEISYIVMSSEKSAETL